MKRRLPKAPSALIRITSPKAPRQLVGKPEKRSKRRENMAGIAEKLKITRLVIEGWRCGAFSFVNDASFRATDFHVIFSGTGGTLDLDPSEAPDKIVTPPGRCRESVITGGNQIDLYFDPAVPIGGTLKLWVWCAFKDIEVLDWWWTKDEAPPYPF